jgi:serine/threonine-protein kinase
MSDTASPSSDDAGLPQPGEVLAGKFRIERLVGRGGMGAVFAARHEILGQRVAIKVLLPQVAKNPEAVARFLNEARAAARIEGEHIARVMDAATLDDGRPYMIIEYLEGTDLAQVLEVNGPLAVTDAVDSILQALEALAQAHALGIVHRDFKPSNLFVARRADGTTLVKVLDFGIAKATQPLTAPDPATMTRSNAVLGSPQYMSPEQLRNAKTVDARTDLWSVGLTLYELLAGSTPFVATTFGELFAAILEDDPAPLRERRPEIEPDLEAIVARCLRRNPADRFQNVAELARALAPHGTPHSRRSVERIASWLPGPAPKPLSSAPPAAESRGTGGMHPPGPASVVKWNAPTLLRVSADGSATAPPLSNTRSASVPRRRAAVVAGAFVAVAAGGAVLAWPPLRGAHGSREAPTVTAGGSPAAMAPRDEPQSSLATSAEPPSPSSVALVPAPERFTPTAVIGAAPAAVARPAPASTKDASTAPALGAAPDASAPEGRSRTRVDETGLARDNPF